jgi:hypothetical protein
MGNKNPHPVWGGNYKKLWIVEKQKSPPSMGWELQKIMDS